MTETDVLGNPETSFNSPVISAKLNWFQMSVPFPMRQRFMWTFVMPELVL